MIERYFMYMVESMAKKERKLDQLQRKRKMQSLLPVTAPSQLELTLRIFTM